MSKCEKCHDKGTIPCPTCKGKKTEPCKKCNGTGAVLCNRCSGDGKITCGWCGGSGTQTEWETCPVCNHGKVTKTRLVNCRTCHGTGTVKRRVIRSGGFVDYVLESCLKCFGRGQEHEEYKDICPACNGNYRKSTEKTCAHCHGRGYFICDTKCGQHKKEIECDNCDGTGQVTCSHCKGEGKEKCPDCEKRETERKQREAEQKRQEEQRRKEEEQRKREAKERKEQEEYRLRCEKEAKAAKRKERREFVQGCGCLIAIVAIIGFFVWWWLEGLTMAALPGMWEQAKNAVGGEALKSIGAVCGSVLGLFLLWKLLKSKKDDNTPKSTRKRWVFIVLGLLLGPFGVHLLYAKRWFLFLLLWTAFVTGGVMSDGKPEKAAGDAAATQAVQQADGKKKDSGSPVGDIGFAVWGLLWIGGTLFIKKDGKGNRM